MSEVNVKLSDAGQDEAIFHDLHYTNDRQGGNHTNTVLEIINIAGNDIEVSIGDYGRNTTTGKIELLWDGSPTSVGAVRISVRGSCENSEFLRMLQLILDAEKMVDIIKP